MIIDETTLHNQRQAANPLNSVWVSASAGSGKTKVLTDRVLNLLLSDTLPERILCLTFTKAAAAEMSNRITQTLKKWTVADDKTLKEELKHLIGLPPTPETCVKARQLFIDVLETPGGMKIMNLHAFCQSVLKRFPIEANVPPQFDIADEAKATMLMKDALHQVLLQPEFEDDIDFLSDYFSEKDMEKLFKHIASNETKYVTLFHNYQSCNHIIDVLKKRYNLSKYHSEKDIFIEYFCPLKLSDYSEEDYICAYEEFTQKATRFLLKNQSDILEKFKDDVEAQEIFALLEKTRLFKTIQITGCMLHITEHVIRYYRTAKRKASLLDYGDLIEKTQSLLSNGTMSSWVMYKMDRGIDHILVDEAQDTSPQQWEIIRLISEEFFAGLGRETNVVRTIFVVGDKKQSIYSFQGADPDEFNRMYSYFNNRIQSAQKTFETIPLNTSFRSVTVVLDLVNKLLDNPQAQTGILKPTEKAIHTAARQGEGGLIEIWPLVSVEKNVSDESWQIPQRQQSESAIVKLSRQIAHKIGHMIQSQEILVSAGRPIQPKDIMILVSKRTGIVPELVRALKEKNIPVAGIDRLNLSSHIAIQDLIAIAQFALLPDDDLTLATILKSPLIKINEKELMRLCTQRQEKSLWQYIQTNNETISQILKDILNQADKIPVYEFFAYLLGPMNGRKAFVSRFGNEVHEAFDEFLALCLEFEQNNVPSLQNFIQWFQNRDNVIKRDLDQSDLNTVKIMTIHGSKGLQGNIVFMPDAQRLPSTEATFFWDNDIPLWIARANLRTTNTNHLLNKNKQLSEEEYHRLLYVALTRARDRLYICGWDKPKKDKSKQKKQTSTKSETKIKSWYDLITESLPEYIVPDSDKIIRMSCPQSICSNNHDTTSSDSDIIQKIPSCLLKQAQQETPLSKPLMPSRLVENDTPELSISGQNLIQAQKKGIFIHKLLQYLPDIEPEKRKETAMRLKPDTIEIPDSLFEIFEKDTFKILFGKNSQAEIPIVGIVQNKVFSGQIDRLIVLENEVWIVDYKTNHFVPSSEEKVSHTYKIQLFAYKELIKNIFPDKLVRTFLLWTENLSLMEMTSEIEKCVLFNNNKKEKI